MPGQSFDANSMNTIPRTSATIHSKENETLLPTPDELRRLVPASAKALVTVREGRHQVRAILEKRDPRLLMIVGPCSLHDPTAALEYARLLADLASELKESMCIVMRSYFEKPRSTIGWKGLLHDPFLDGSGRMADGLVLARRLLVQINDLGLPTATEILHPLSPAWLGDMLSWAAIGARTTESQVHRELASGLDIAVGFKNGTDGNLSIAIQALQASGTPQTLPFLNSHGHLCVKQTRGNALAHLVLRGGAAGPNYDAQSIANAGAALQEKGLPQRVIVDCSHANSGKLAHRQTIVLRDLIGQRAGGQSNICGAMIESNLLAGSQAMPTHQTRMRYGCSITDPCIDWPTTASLLRDIHEQSLLQLSCAANPHQFCGA